MKILIFSTAYLPFIGGAEIAITEITDRIGSPSPLFRGGSEGGASFSLITARFTRSVPKQERIGNIHVYRVGFGTALDKWLLPWLGSRKAEQLEREEKFDCVWSMMASQASIAATWFKEKHMDTKLVLTLQEGDEEAHLKRYVFGSEFLYQLFIRSWHVAVFKYADVITAISNYLAKRARMNSSAEVVVIPNGVDVGKFEYRISNIEKEEIRKRLGIGKEDKVVITTSRLVEKNGVGDLIGAMRYLPDNVKLVIIGSGFQEGALKKQAAEFESRVLFLGTVPNNELPPYLHAADVFCRPSLSEGQGISFLEAMAAGLPVIATPVGGIPDFLKDRETGLFCEVRNPRSIAEKIQKLLSDEALRSRIVSNASNMVAESYDWSGISEKMRDALVNPS